MDRAAIKIEDQEDGTGKSSWSTAVLRSSWWIGKRVAIAGAAITSAPVIIPPLFVLSALGIAFSFPFGIYLAGYVCADKIMSVLLPLSEDLIERGFDADQGDEMVLEFGHRNGVERPAVESDVEGEVDEVKTLLGEEVREDVTAAPGSSGSPKSPYTVVVIAAYEESDKKEYEPPSLSSEHLSIVELRGEGKANDTLAMKELREDGGEEEKRVKVANGVVAQDKELSEERRIDVPRLKSDHVMSAVIVPSKDEDVENLGEVGSMERRSLAKPVPAAVVAVDVTGLHSHDEISALERTRNEEQLWDQVFSMRAIVGYKATLQPSLGEELMALYLLIGVEPPFSLKDTADIAEINNSLELLKSVVGVK